MCLRSHRSCRMFSSQNDHVLVQSSSVCVKCGKLCSLYFGISNGVRQGGILSPERFSVYVDELLRRLSDDKIGSIINGISVNHVFDADDLCVMYNYSPLIYNAEC